MKRSNKVLSLVIALVFLFSAVTPAFASQETAGGTLAALGVIEGDTSGDLNLDSNVTRAEMCVILARLAGLEDAADVLEDVPSTFSDVKSGAWYTGWINLASQQGWVSGYPDGTFNPSGNVTYAEAYAMILNVLGYEADGLAGPWPLNYLVKAAELGLTDDVDFSANAAAVRGDIFIIVEAALYEDYVVLDEDTDVSGIFVSLGENPLEKMGYDVVENVRVADAEILLGGSIAGDALLIDEDGDTETYDVDEDFDLSPYIGYVIDVVVDGDEIFGAVIVEDAMTTVDDITESAIFFDDGDDDYYDFASDVVVIENFSAMGSSTSNIDGDVVDVMYTLNDDDEVSVVMYTYMASMDATVLVEDIEEDDDEITLEYYVDADTADIDPIADEDTDVWFFGDAASWDDVEEYDVLSYIAVGDELGIWVTRDVVSGDATASRSDELKVDGDWYDFDSAVLVSEDNGEEFVDGVATNSLVGEEVEVALDMNGDAFAVWGDIVEAADDLAYVTVATTWYMPVGGIGVDEAVYEVELFLLDSGEKVIYEYEDFEGDDRQDDVMAGYIVEYSLDEDGLLDVIEYAEVTTDDGIFTVDDGAGSLDNNNLYFGDSDTVAVFTDEANDYDDIELISWSDVMDQDNVVATIVYERDDYDYITYVFTGEELSTATSDYVVFVDYAVLEDGDVEVSFLGEDGVVSAVYTDADEDNYDLSYGCVYSYTMSGGEFDEITAESCSIYNIDDIITINGVDYMDIAGGLKIVTDDTVFVDATDLDDIVLIDADDVEVDDDAIYIVDEDNELEIVVLR